MDENDLSEMIKNISQMINDGNIPDEVKNIVNNLNSNNEAKNNSSSNTSNIDINTILKMKSIFDKINSTEDPRANLLRSLKPYLKENRKSKIDQYIQLFNMSKALEVFKFDGGDVTK